MIFNQDQIFELLEIIDNNTKVFIAQRLGEDYLTKQEKKKLFDLGVDVSTLYNEKLDVTKQSFYFGLISDSLGKDANNITFEELKNHFEKGEHIPFTSVEKYTLDSIKRQSLSDIRAHQNRIFEDVNNIISSKEKNKRTAYEKIIRKEVIEGQLKKKTTREIAQDLARKTGDWSRNYLKAVEYISHSAFNEGRLAAIERANENAKIYFDTYPGACKHCIRLYLTNGIGSQPKIFTINELKENGSNIGRKVEEWKATITPIHVYCRCTVNKYIEGMIWDDKMKRFDWTKELEIKNRNPIKWTITIKGKKKEYLV